MAQPNQPGWPAAPPAAVYVAAPPTNGMAIAALIMAFVFYPVGIVLGHLARGQIRRKREGGKGLATAALILSYLQLAVTVGVILAMTDRNQEGAPASSSAGKLRIVPSFGPNGGGVTALLTF